MSDPVTFDGDRVTYHGRTYRVGQSGTPLALTTLLPAAITEWREMRSPFADHGVGRDYSRAYVHPDGLLVIVSAMLYDDRKRWLHVSVSHRGNRLPVWREMCLVKEAFCGAGSTAYQVHPPQDKYVNIHQKVLHVFCCLDGPVTPDFTSGGETI